MTLFFSYRYLLKVTEILTSLFDRWVAVLLYTSKLNNSAIYINHVTSDLYSKGLLTI